MPAFPARRSADLPLFPGENEPKQFELIMEINGLPPKSVLDKATRKNAFFNENEQPLHNSIPRCGIGMRNLSKTLKCDDKDFIDFIKRCLEWNSKKRITPEEALEHPWITKGSKVSNIGTARRKSSLIQVREKNQKLILQNVSNLVAELSVKKYKGNKSYGKGKNLKYKIKLMTNRASIDSKPIMKENAKRFSVNNSKANLSNGFHARKYCNL